MKVANKFDCITSAQRNICPIKLRTYQFENRGRSARPRKCLNLTPLIGYQFVNLINVAAALGPEIVLTYPNQKYRLSFVKLICGRIARPGLIHKKCGSDLQNVFIRPTKTVFIQPTKLCIQPPKVVHPIYKSMCASDLH